MKIIHTADVHLDSPLAGVADGKLRRRELLRALSNVAEYAKNNGVQAVIVAGDLFDENSVSSETVKQTAQNTAATTRARRRKLWSGRLRSWGCGIKIPPFPSTVCGAGPPA